MRALERRPTTLERWPKGVHPGIVVSTRERGGGDAFFQKRIPRGAPDYVTTARIQFPSGRHADEICPTEVAVVAWAAQMGTITFHPWPVRSDDVDHPDELRIDLDPQPGTDFADAVRVAAEARVLLDKLGYTGFPKTSGGRGVHIYVRIERRWTFTDVRHAAIAFGRELERRLQARSRPNGGRRSAASASSSTTTRTRAIARSPRLTASGRSRARRSPHRWRGTSSRRSRLRTSPSRRCPRALPRWAISTRRSTTPPTRCSRCWTSTRTTPTRDEGDMPYPPDYPKMPGEPKRVQPSRDRDRPR